MPLQISFLSNFNLEKIAAGGMPIIFSLWLGVFVLLGIVLSYHWREYGYNIIGAWLFTAIYFALGIGFLAGMFIAKSMF